MRQVDASRNPDFWDRDVRVVRYQSLCAGVTDITLLMDVCRGAMVTGAAAGPYAGVGLLLSQTNRFML